MTTRERFGRVMLVVGTCVALAVPLGGTANAAPRDGTCDANEFCLYYLYDQQGSLSDFAVGVDIRNYGDSQPSCYEFRGRGDGEGECVKNNAQSVHNRTNRPVRVYYNSGHGGISDLIDAGEFRNLARTIDNNASHKFL